MRASIIILLGVVLCGCAALQSLKDDRTADQKRAEVRAERDEILDKVYEDRPELEAKVSKAPGYATFSTVNVNLLLLSTERGSGMAVDNTGKETFMKMMSVGGGIGAGIRDLRALFVFNDPGTFQEFLDSGWQFGGQADASLKSGEKGIEAGESVSVAKEEGAGIDTGITGGLAEATGSDTAIEVYRITEAGVSLQATIAGTKYWKDEELNQQ